MLTKSRYKIIKANVCQTTLFCVCSHSHSRMGPVHLTASNVQFIISGAKNSKVLTILHFTLSIPPSSRARPKSINLKSTSCNYLRIFPITSLNLEAVWVCRSKDNVVMLDVQVDDPVLVEELQGFQHLSSYHSALGLSQGKCFV